MNIKNDIKRAVNLLKAKNYVPVYQTKSNQTLLEGNTILITGGSGGIGFAISKKCIESGAKVILSGTNVNKLRKRCDDLGPNASYIVLNMTDPETFSKAVDEAEAIFGELDALVCSAGIHANYMGLNFLNVSIDQYDSIMSVNLRGTYFLIQEVCRRFVERSARAHVLLVSSQSALEPAWSPYRLSKHGVAEITSGIAQQMVKYGIVVNGIGPGPTATSMQPYVEGGSIFTPDNPIERYTMPSEVAEYAVLLLSHLGDTVIGETIYMSGGRGIINVM